MKKRTKIIGGIVAFGIIGNLFGFGDDEGKEIKAEPAKVEAVAIEESAPVVEKKSPEQTFYEENINQDFRVIVDNYLKLDDELQDKVYFGKKKMEKEEYDLEDKVINGTGTVIDKPNTYSKVNKRTSTTHEQYVWFYVYFGDKTSFEGLTREQFLLKYPEEEKYIAFVVSSEYNYDVQEGDKVNFEGHLDGLVVYGGNSRIDGATLTKIN